MASRDSGRAPAARFLDVVDVTAEQDLDAGEFAGWLAALLDALAHGGGMAVPCGDCDACCRSAYFVHIGADETEALARIPRALRFPAPGASDAWVMGFDERGRCPMLRAGGCAIYEHRPLTCRQFDCRVFAAARVDPSADDQADEQADMAARARRWRFRYGATDDAAGPARRLHAAVATTARLLARHADRLGRRGLGNRTQLAVLAVRLHPAILALEQTWRESGRLPDADRVAQTLLDAVQTHDPAPAPSAGPGGSDAR